MSSRRTKVFFDGGCRPNPGPMEAAVVVRGAVHFFDDLGAGSNEDAEWLALIRALDLARAQGLADFALVGDALAVIRQAQAALSGGPDAAGPDAQGPDAQDHAARFLAAAAPGPLPRLRWIKREQNLAGIALASRHPR